MKSWSHYRTTSITMAEDVAGIEGASDPIGSAGQGSGGTGASAAAVLAGG
jgi:hypothetical protein